jgi:DNA-binding NarL/FixJ family response regulator
MPSTEATTPATTAAAISTVLIDDHRIFLDAFGNLLAHDGRIVVVASAATTNDGVDAVDDHRPQLVVLDVDIDGAPVEETLRRIQRISPDSAVVIVTMHNHAPLRDALLRAGARAFLSKSMAGAELIGALVEAATTPADTGATGPARRETNSLSDREREVLRLMSLAQSNKQIGAQLGISEGTVKRHVYGLFQKLGATSRVDAVRKASNLGLLR